MGSNGIQWDPSGSKKDCQKKERISAGIFDKEGKINSENWHMSDLQWILTGFDRFCDTWRSINKGEKADPGIRWDPLGSKKNCQKKEGISSGIFDKEGKMNSEDWHMSDFQWILAGFDRFATSGVAVVGIQWDPPGSGIQDPLFPPCVDLFEQEK